MAEDTFSESTTQGWLGRLGDSIKGVVTGLVLVAVGALLLFWNEGKAVKTARDLAEGAKTTVTVKSDAVLPANEGRLVHLNAVTNTTQHLEDRQFGVSPKENVLKLRRQVQMYQWKEDVQTEKTKNLGGSETTTKTYKYRTDWSSSLIDSNGFKQAATHRNPTSMPFAEVTQVASPITAGAFVLGPELISQIGNFLPLAVTPSDPVLAGPEAPAGQIPPILPANVKVAGTGYYVGANPASPQVGDTKIDFSIVKSGPVSIVAKQAGGQLVAAIGSSGTSIAMLSTGTLAAKEMFQAAEAANNIRTWILRLVGFLAIWFGLMAILKPFTVLADVLPLLGDLLGMGLAVGTFFVGAAMSVVVIAIGWLAYRPVLGIGLLVVAIGGIVWLKMAGQSRRTAPTPAA